MINVGSQAAENVLVTLTTEDLYIDITDNSENYGNIPAGETISIADAFEFEILDGVPDMHLAQFFIEAVGQETWESGFSIEVYAPNIEIGNLIISDSEFGNGDGKLDAGEMAEVQIQVFNNGHAGSENCEGFLSTTSSYLSITNSEFTLGEMGAETEAYALFDVTVDPEAPAGSIVDLVFDVSAGAYGANTIFL